MSVTDRALLAATQIAYYDFDSNLLLANHYQAPLYELLRQNMTIRIRLEHALIHAKAQKDTYKTFRAEQAIWLYEELVDEYSEYGRWIIRLVHDDNKNSGFYGCLIDVGEGTAVAAIRGSESTDAQQIEKDWIDADLGLMNTALTGQQLAAQEFVKEIKNCGYYSWYYMTGHSLGGNLAHHAAVCAPKEIKSRVVKSINYDGPGYSEEYIAYHHEDIKQIEGKLVHYQWSLVGNLLNPLPGEERKILRTDDLVYQNYEMEALLQKHDTGFVLFDKHQNVVPGEIDRFADTIGTLTRAIDNCPDWVGNALAGLIGQFILMTEAERKVYARSMLAGLAELVTAYPIPVLAGMTAIACMILAEQIDPDFFGKAVIPIIGKTTVKILDVIDIAGKTINKILRKVCPEEEKAEQAIVQIANYLPLLLEK